MRTFIYHLRLIELLRPLRENFYDLNHAAYDQLFATELKRLSLQAKDPKAKGHLEDMANDFKFTAYVASSVRQSGVQDEQERNQRTHDVISKLLLGKLFDFDPDAIPFIARFKTSVANAIRNQSAKQSNRTRLLPSIPILNEPGVGISPDEIAGRELQLIDDGLIGEFRALVNSRLGALGTAVLDLRLNGGETKSLIGSDEHGQPTSYRIKQVVLGIKQIAHEFAQERGDDEFLRQVTRAMDSEQTTMKKRFEQKLR
ncbi:hypothetical protein [Rosistilla oblonga]|uniref:hypothetical protein n=1 Tax=Rosistilla oblonga TaxID=2527990 RepID=UPI003A97F733